MTVDLLHNRIVKDTISESFSASVTDILCPMLSEKFGESLLGIQMYEDFLSDEFVKDKRWYYPMTAVLDSGIETVWVSWDISKKDAFTGGNPYAFVGEKVDFVIEDNVPFAFVNALEGRARYFEGGYVKLNVVCNVPDITMLSGKYSQTFVDELNRQISSAICRAAGVSGIENSSIEVDVVFTPETYMEHTSENVTYRRLLMTAKGCAARDFWVKWTHLDSHVASSIADNVTAEDIVFEIGEDVPHKIREKEYRFLVYGKSEKYRAAMGRKNITEWRELIKRAVKRGELIKEETETELDDHVAEAEDRLAEILAQCGIAVPKVEESVSEDIDETKAALLSVLSGSGAEAYAPEEDTVNTAVPVQSAEVPEEENEDEETLAAIGDTEFDIPVAPEEEPEVELPSDNSEEERIRLEIEAARRKLEEEREAMERARRELEEARERVQNEAHARMLAEAEAQRLREEQDNLKRENERLAEERRIAEEIREREEAARREQEQKLREQIELEAREKAREKLLFAEAARLAREEHERMVAERNAEQERVRAEEARIAALRQAEEEKLLEEERIRKERERIENELRERAEENARRRREIEERAKEARERMENEARIGADAKASQSSDYARAEAPIEEEAPRVENSEEIPSVSAPVESVAEPTQAPSSEEAPRKEATVEAPKSTAYTYTSRIARLLFRRNIDPNVNARIRELISAALAQFGKQHVYIKVRASIPDNTTVILNFVKIPEQELDLLVDIVKYLGNSDLGIYKIIVE